MKSLVRAQTMKKIVRLCVFARGHPTVPKEIETTISNICTIEHTRALKQAPKLEWIKIGSQAQWISHVRDCVSIDKNQLDKLRIMIIALGQCTQFAHSDSHKCSRFVCFFLFWHSKYTCWLFRFHLKCPFFSRSNGQNIFDLRTQLNEIDMVLLYAYRLCITVYFLNYMTCRWYGLRLFLSLWSTNSLWFDVITVYQNILYLWFMMSLWMHRKEEHLRKGSFQWNKQHLYSDWNSEANLIRYFQSAQ